MKIAITGVSGFVGTSLKNHFLNKGYLVVDIRRGDLSSVEALKAKIDGCDVVINLAGASIIARWSDEYKKVLRSSRLDTTNLVVDAISISENKPKLLISTSAVGIFANSGTFDEENYIYSNDFLGKLCQEWESVALKAKSEDTRVAIFRFGIVLGRDGGALKQMLTPFKFGLGGTIGNGLQAFSYVHIDDLIRAYDFVIENSSLEGAFNLTAPEPTTNKGLTKALGKYLHRPTILPVPEFVLGLIFGEGARVLTDGQSVKPKRLLDSGFEFKYKNIEQAIENLVK
ncbi:TIGR01777 family oxidoreductase [Arcobacter sp. FWKO B]|uniref:TIGR01777 family oxidoreductase n=1 Tax=Arcobacter sp. FWKO B TaxID=2593672 RepID=UPI0018A63A3D|nr:TIGR01777 family oxidoreductase [Arcobacter sp. FWKO B]QOG11595.1 TIGR01777 family protein [Arcobacter sp. FWKO B]